MNGMLLLLLLRSEELRMRRSGYELAKLMDLLLLALDEVDKEPEESQCSDSDKDG